MEIKNSEQFLISSKNSNNNNELNRLKEESVILKKEIEDFKNEVIALKSNIFLLEEKNNSLIQKNEIIKRDLDKKENLISSLK